MRLNKILALFLCMSLLVTMMVGCGKTENSSSDTAEEVSSTETSGEQVEIRYAIWDKNQEPYLKETADEFMKANPNIKITIEVSAWNEYWTKLEASAVGGSIADVFWINGPNVTKYAKGEILLPLDDYIANSNLDLSQYPASLIDLYTIDGKQYAMPKDFDTVAVWYNKAIFDEAGVDYPTDDWTWDDMVEIAGKLTNKENGIYGIAAPYANQEGLYNTVLANGGYIISEDKTKSGYDLEATKKGIQCWVDILEKGYSPSETSLEETLGSVQFESGKIGMVWAGSWKITEFSQTEAIADTIDCVELPSINGKKASIIHGLGNCVYAKTKHPKEAQMWVEFLSGAAGNKIQGESGAVIPAYTPALSIWSEAYPNYNVQAYLKAAQDYSYAYPVSANTAEWQQYEADYLKMAFGLTETVDEACDKLAEEMNNVLAAE